MGFGLKIYEITDEYISFDFEAPHSGHATVYTAEKAYFTGKYTATAVGTEAYGDTPYDTHEIIYDFTFTDHNINLKVYTPGTSRWDIDYYSNGTINNSISVILNGSELSFEQPPIIKDDRTLVPLRAIFEAMGATVVWDSNTQTVTSSKGNTTVTMTINSYELYKNGAVTYIDVPAQLIGDYTMVPARAVAEAFGAEVIWDGNAQTVYINN